MSSHSFTRFQKIKDNNRTNLTKSSVKILEIRKKNQKTPSPESLMRVSNKLEVLNIFKSSFQNQKSNARFLTPIPKSEPKIPSVNLTTLNIKNYGLGDNQAKVLSSAIKSMNRLEKVNIRGNGMNDTGTFSILDSVNRENIKDLDISLNKIGVRSIESLAEMLETEYSSLEDLNLENSKISLKGLIQICGSLKHNRCLKTLNLANNKIGLGSGPLFADLFDYNNSLESLDLQWNFIRASDASLFFQALKNNNGLKTLDLSWNSLGNDKITKSIHDVADCLANNETLEHLDLSQNKFSMQDCKILAEKLKNNHKIKGLHFEGNYAKIDSLGHIVPMPYIVSTKSAQQAPRLTSKTLQKSFENCWICNKWTDLKIEWDPARVVWNRRLKHFALDKLSSQVEPVYIHLEIDNYLPFLLTRNDSNVYFCIRALPPGKIRFFFTYRGVAQISNQYPVEATDGKIEKKMHFYGNFSKVIMAVVVNFCENSGNELNSVPRPEISEYVPPPGDVPEPNIPPWLFENSIFSGFIQDTPDLLNKCFEADWNNSKLQKLLKFDLSKFACKEILRQEYQKIFYAYRYLAALSLSTSLFCVNLNTITDFYSKKGIFDKHFKLSDLDLNIRASTFNAGTSQFNNAFSVVRHEFLELQVRVALDKFIRIGNLKSESEAVAKFFDSGWDLILNPNEWRNKRLYNEECDIVLTNNKELLVNVYETTKGKFTKVIDRKGMMEEDFVLMMQEHGFFNEKFTMRYGYICFHLSLMAKIDETSGISHMQASFVEFLEAFARICDLSDSDDLEKDIIKGYPDENEPLDKKIETAIYNFNYLKQRRGRR